MTRVTALAVAAMMLSLVASGTSLASTMETIDQVQEHGPSDFILSGAGTLPGIYRIAQTFTVGRSGLLTRVDILVSSGNLGGPLASNPLSVALVDATSGVPAGPALTTGAVLPEAPDGSGVTYYSGNAAGTNIAFATVELSPSLPVSVGDKLAIVASAPDEPSTGGAQWAWWGVVGFTNPVDSYDGGDGMIDYPGGWKPYSATWPFDLDFRTYVADAAPICTWGRILPPVNAVDDANQDGISGYKFGARGVIPAKFRLTCNGDLVDTPDEAAAAGPALLRVGKVADDGSVLSEFTSEALVTGSANTGNEFRFDDPSNQFIYNISLKAISSRGAYRIKIEGAGDTQAEFFRIV